MKFPKTILRGYDRVTMKTIAKALGITLKPKRKGGDKRMKIPMSFLTKGKAKADDKKAKPKGGMKFGAMKGKKAKDNDADDY